MEIKDEAVFELLAGNINTIARDISEMKVTLAEQAKDLEMHIKRTELNEESIALLRTELTPAKDFSTFIKIGLQVIGALAVVLAVATALIKLT